MTIKITRRHALAGVASGAIAVPVLSALDAAAQSSDALHMGVQAIITQIRSLPGSTLVCVYQALQDVADQLEQLTA